MLFSYTFNISFFILHCTTYLYITRYIFFIDGNWAYKHFLKNTEHFYLEISLSLNIKLKSYCQELLIQLLSRQVGNLHGPEPQVTITFWNFNQNWRLFYLFICHFLLKSFASSVYNLIFIKKSLSNLRKICYYTCKFIN